MMVAPSKWTTNSFTWTLRRRSDIFHTNTSALFSLLAGSKIVSDMDEWMGLEA